MKKINLMLALGAAALIAGCSKTDTPAEGGPVAVKFSAGIGGHNPVTRASGTAWSPGDAIGVYMVDNGTTDPAAGAENRRYTTILGNGEFTADPGQEIFFPVNGTDMFDFIAYYPHIVSVTNYTYPVDVSSQTNPAAIDLLWVNSHNLNTTGYNKNTPEVSLRFEHQLSKFVIKTSPGAGLSAADLRTMTVKINGMDTRAGFDLKAGTVTGETDPAVLTPINLQPGEVYEAIILPALSAADGDWYVEFIIGSDTYVWKMDGGSKFESGKEHEWGISVQKTPVVITSSIKDWVPGQGGPGVAD